MKFIPVIKWTFALILIAAAVAGGAGFYVLNHKDRFVQQEIQKRFAAVAPELSLSIGGTSVQGTGSVTLRNLEVRERQSGKALFRAKELHVDIDSNQLLEHQQVVVDRVHLKSADILLTRENDGRWNWQNYRFVPPDNAAVAALPEIILDDVAVQLTLRHGPNIPAARLLLLNSQLLAVPKSSHAYDFDGAINLPGAGKLKLAGQWDLDTRQWKLGGRIRDVQADEELMSLARATAPGIDGHLDHVDSLLERAVPDSTSTTQTPQGAALLIGHNGAIAPQFQGSMDIAFDISGSPDSRVPLFELLVEVNNGRLASPAIPFEFSNVQARFYRNNQTLSFQLDEAQGETASVTGGMELDTGPNAKPGKAWFDIKRFPITSKLRPLLPEKTLRLFDNFKPEGTVSVSGSIQQEAEFGWRLKDVKAEVHDGTALYHKFRYPVSGLKGTITQRPYAVSSGSSTESPTTQRDVMMDIRISGVARNRPFEATGWWKNPGPQAETRIQMSAENVALDSHFRNALDEKSQAVFDSLAISGFANAALVFYRPPGLEQPTHTLVDARVHKASMRFTRFPYSINELTGHITFNSATRHWQFLELAGRHGEGQLSATGSFRGSPSPGVLDLTVRATGAALDSDLYNALPRAQQSLWKMINPEGFCNVTAQIGWTAEPGQAPVVSFPAESPVRIYNAHIRPNPFPFDMDVQEATLSFDPNDVRAAGAQHCEIHSIKALHDGAPLQASGWAEAKPNGEWQLHLNHVNAANLQPDDHLRAALPNSWRQTLGRIYQVGRVSVENSEIDFRGDMHGQFNPTAAWKLNLSFRDCMLNAGLDVSHLFGTVTATGMWDGYRLRNDGYINLETAEVLDMPFTNIRGPYSLNEVELVLGSRKVFEAGNPLSSIDRSNRIKALAYGGELLLDAHVDLREDGRYQFFTELENARLESYAALHIPEQQNLKGVVNAWLSLEGSGEQARDVEGKGQMLISPAALYEVPVIVKLLGSLSQLNLNIQDRTAFEYAFVDFAVKDEAFLMERVDLVGDAIGFRGRGIVGFGGAVNLDFYSRPARSRAAALPIISGLFTNWAKVEVRGTTDRPQTAVKSAARLDEGLRLFLQPFNPGGPAPGLNIPQFFQQPGPLLQRRRLQNAQTPSGAIQ